MTKEQEKERSQNSWQHVQLARRPDRPHTLDYIRLLTTDFIELHGDRHYGDDGAIVGGPARFSGRTVMIIGHQKGSTTKENLARNFAQAMPEGYRKALRLMRHAQKFGMPLITFIDTPGANPGIESEERGQAQAIADNLLAMLQLEVPVISVVIGEGGSGGALAIGVADRILMLENAIYSVASPEASAAILWRDAGQARAAAEAMRITAQDLLQFGVADEIIPEPAGGAQNDVAAVIESTRTALLRHLRELENTYSQRGRLGIRKMLEQRAAKYTNIGMFLESAEAEVEVETDTADIGPALVAPTEAPLNGGTAHDSGASHDAEPTGSANGTNGANGAAEQATPIAAPTRQRSSRSKKQERPAE